MSTLRVQIFGVLNFRILGEMASMLNFCGYKFSPVLKRLPGFFMWLIMHRCGQTNTSARDRPGPWQGVPPRSFSVLPLWGGSSAVLPALLMGAGTMPSRFCKQLACWGDDSVIATNSSDTGFPGCSLDHRCLHWTCNYTEILQMRTHVYTQVTCENVTEDYILRMEYDPQKWQNVIPRQNLYPYGI